MRPNGILPTLAARAQSISIRHLVAFLGGILLLSTTLLLFTSTNLSTDKLQTIKFDLKDSVSQLKDKVHVPTIFKPVTHLPPPPPAANSTGSTEGWFASWSWMNPFSGDDTGERIALPPLVRCSIYTYYDPTTKDKKQLAIEDKMLLAWRRAWWAYGFKPMILGPEEAKLNGLYEIVYRTKFTPELTRELMKWLAWSQVEGGVLIDHWVFPMGPHDDSTISALRRCKFLYMNRYTNFDQKLYTSDISSLSKILMYITSNPPEEKKNVTTIEDAISVVANPEDWMHVDSFPESLADYSPDVVKAKYKDLNPADLPGLVNAHLHSNFLSYYPDGIHLLSPFGEKLNALNHPALELANRLAACPVKNPLPESCPPNLHQCTPCKKTAAITSPKHLSETSKAFTLGTIPHPFITVEMTNEHNMRLLEDPEDRSIRYVRRKTSRDPWLKEVTKEPFMKTGLPSPPRASKIKELVAAKQNTKFTGMWSSESEGFRDAKWVLGFTPPTIDELELKLPSAEESQKVKLEAAKVAAKAKSRLVRVIEAWNLGDAEVWRFVNAWRERKVLERTKWSALEKKFGHGLDTDER